MSIVDLKSIMFSQSQSIQNKIALAYQYYNPYFESPRELRIGGIELSSYINGNLSSKHTTNSKQETNHTTVSFKGIPVKIIGKRSFTCFKPLESIKSFNLQEEELVKRNLKTEVSIETSKNNKSKEAKNQYQIRNIFLKRLQVNTDKETNSFANSKDLYKQNLSENCAKRNINSLETKNADRSVLNPKLKIPKPIFHQPHNDKELINFESDIFKKRDQPDQFSKNQVNSTKLTISRINGFTFLKEKTDMIMEFKEQKRNKFLKKWEFRNLYTFLKTYYLDSVYDPSYIDSFTERETIVFKRLINKKQDIFNTSNDEKSDLKKTAYFVFNGTEERKRGYKITNNKRFVFRKIKTLLMNRYLIRIKKKNALKNERDNYFFNYYFASDKEYEKLNTTDQKKLYRFLDVYEESKIKLIWRFDHYVTDFSHMFYRFEDELRKTYYNEKLSKLKAFLVRLTKKPLESLNKARLPMKNLPLNHNVIKEYMQDFYNSYGYFLKEYQESKEN